MLGINTLRFLLCDSVQDGTITLQKKKGFRIYREQHTRGVTKIHQVKFCIVIYRIKYSNSIRVRLCCCVSGYAIPKLSPYYIRSNTMFACIQHSWHNMHVRHRLYSGGMTYVCIIYIMYVFLFINNPNRVYQYIPRT